MKFVFFAQPVKDMVILAATCQAKQVTSILNDMDSGITEKLLLRLLNRHSVIRAAQYKGADENYYFLKAPISINRPQIAITHYVSEYPFIFRIE